MFKEIREHKRRTLFICYFTATPGDPKLLLEWQFGDYAMWVLSEASEESLQLAFGLERCLYICQHHHIVH